MENAIKRHNRGGKREGAGRPEGTGKYGQPTKAIRVPCNLIEYLQNFLAQYRDTPTTSPPHTLAPYLTSALQLPLYQDKVSAGFPAPAYDQLDSQLDLNTYLVKNPKSTFYVRVIGDSMQDAGIYPNDLLVVDRAMAPKDGSIVIAMVNGEFTTKRLRMSAEKRIQLIPENANYPIITITESMEFSVWGVVTNVIHALN